MQILRRHLDTALAERVERAMLASGMAPGEVWSDLTPSTRMFAALPQLERAMTETKSLQDVVSTSRIEKVVLNDERAFDRQYDDYLAGVEAGERRRFMAEVRNQFKMWHCIRRLVDSIDTSLGSGTDYLLLCRPDLQVLGSWIEHFPMKLDSSTVYTDIERNCLTVGLGGLGDRYVLVPMEYARVLAIPDRLRTRAAYDFDRPEQRVRLSWHQLLESILVQSGVSIDVSSIKLPFGLQRRVFGLADVEI
jgi:hypothetical protein